MKLLIAILLFLLASISLYTIFNLLTFSPDEPQPFVFSDPVLPPDVTQETTVTLTPEEKEKQDNAISTGQTAIAQYRLLQDSAPKQVKETIAILVSRISNWEVPSYFLSAPVAANGNLRTFEPLNIDLSNIALATDAQTSVDCGARDASANVLVGSSAKDTLKCTTERNMVGPKSVDALFIGGPEADVISDFKGNRIINGGTGDDKITLGEGRSIIVLDAAWGNDTVTVNCHTAAIKPEEIPKDFAIPWVYKTSNFIILGNGIDPKDVAWKGNVLTNTLTGDTLTVNENCFTVLPRVD
jgi:hypothetical protein